MEIETFKICGQNYSTNKSKYQKKHKHEAKDRSHMSENGKTKHDKYLRTGLSPKSNTYKEYKPRRKVNEMRVRSRNEHLFTDRKLLENDFKFDNKETKNIFLNSRADKNKCESITKFKNFDVSNSIYDFEISDENECNKENRESESDYNESDTKSNVLTKNRKFVNPDGEKYHSKSESNYTLNEKSAKHSVDEIKLANTAKKRKTDLVRSSTYTTDLAKNKNDKTHEKKRKYIVDESTDSNESDENERQDKKKVYKKRTNRKRRNNDSETENEIKYMAKTKKRRVSLVKNDSSGSELSDTESYDSEILPSYRNIFSSHEIKANIREYNLKILSRSRTECDANINIAYIPEGISTDDIFRVIYQMGYKALSVVSKKKYRYEAGIILFNNNEEANKFMLSTGGKLQVMNHILLLHYERSNDWTCSLCNSYNFQWREECMNCSCLRTYSAAINGDFAFAEITDMPTNRLLLQNLDTLVNEEILHDEISNVLAEVNMHIQFDVTVERDILTKISNGTAYISTSDLQDSICLYQILTERNLLIMNRNITVHYSDQRAKMLRIQNATAHIDTKYLTLAQNYAKSFARTFEEYKYYYAYYLNFIINNKDDIEEKYSYMPDGENGREYSPPDTTKLIYNEEYHCYYDPETWLLYYPATGYFYNSVIMKYLCYDIEKKQYFQVATTTTKETDAINQATPSELSSSEPNPPKKNKKRQKKAYKINNKTSTENINRCKKTSGDIPTRNLQTPCPNTNLTMVPSSNKSALTYDTNMTHILSDIFPDMINSQIIEKIQNGTYKYRDRANERRIGIVL